MGLSRRAFLLALSGGAASLTLGASNVGSLLAAIPAKKKTPYNLDNIVLYTQGRNGDKFHSSDKYTKNKNISIITKLIVKTGEVIQEQVPIFSAHSVSEIKKHEKLFLISQSYDKSAILSPDMKVTSLLETLPDYEFSGHGIPLLDGEHIALSIRTQASRKAKKRGKLAVYNIKTLKLEEIYDTSGYNPHDMAINKEKTHLILSHKNGIPSYEDQISEEFDKAKTEGLYRAKITLLRLSDLSIDRHIYAPKENAPIHLDVTDNGKVYSVSNTFFNKKKGTPPFPITPEEKERPIYNPTPILEYDLSSGETREIISDLYKQRRSQSIAFNRNTGKTSAVFAFTNTLVVIDKNGEAKNYDTKKFKINEPIGLQDIPDTSLIAIGGTYDDISIIDLETMELVQSFKCRLYRSSHITASTI